MATRNRFMPVIGCCFSTGAGGSQEQAYIRDDLWQRGWQWFVANKIPAGTERAMLLWCFGRYAEVSESGDKKLDYNVIANGKAATMMGPVDYEMRVRQGRVKNVNNCFRGDPMHIIEDLPAALAGRRDWILYYAPPWGDSPARAAFPFEDAQDVWDQLCYSMGQIPHHDIVGAIDFTGDSPAARNARRRAQLGQRLGVEPLSLRGPEREGWFVGGYDTSSLEARFQHTLNNPTQWFTPADAPSREHVAIIQMNYGTPEARFDRAMELVAQGHTVACSTGGAPSMTSEQVAALIAAGRPTVNTMKIYPCFTNPVSTFLGTACAQAGVQLELMVSQININSAASDPQTEADRMASRITHRHCHRHHRVLSLVLTSALIRFAVQSIPLRFGSSRSHPQAAQ